MTKINDLKPKHGVPVTINIDNRGLEIIDRIGNLYTSSSTYLAAMVLSHQNGKIKLPCVQCVKDTALEFEEIGLLLRELVEGK